MSSPFDYEPLPADGSQIRLVTVLPGQRSDEIQCMIENTAFDENHPYTALSYVWGKPGATKPIELNGSEFQITQNLEAALRSVRREDEIQTYWIDAMCINQRSVPERNQEVKRMKLIYQRATGVFIWLGRETEPTDSQSMKESILATACSMTFKLLEMLAEPGGDAAMALANNFGSEDMLAIEMLARLYMRPWLLRIWILQEVAYAKTAIVGYGSQRISWELFVVAYQALERLKEGQNAHVYNMSGASRVDSVYRVRLRVTSGQSQQPRPVATQLLDLLWQTRFSEMTDPRDRLFGILGLVQGDTSNALLEIDYGKTAAKVFRNLALYLLFHGHLDQVLCAVTHGLTNLPSWAPIWSVTIREKPDDPEPPRSKLSTPLSTYMQIAQFRQTGPSKPQLSGDLDEISLRGSIVDLVGLVSKTFSDEDSNLDETLRIMLDRFAEWEDEMESWPNHHAFPSSAQRKNMWRCAVLHESADDETWIRSQYEKYLGPNGVRNRRVIPKAREDAAVTKLWVDLNFMFGADFKVRRPFVTMNGLMGSSSRNCDLLYGDVICIFEGSAVPYILRCVEGRSLVFQLVSPSWVPGLMDMDLHDPDIRSSFEMIDIKLI